MKLQNLNTYPTDVLVTGLRYNIFLGSQDDIFGSRSYGRDTLRICIYTWYCEGLRGAEKMSKSLGNGVDPLEVIDEYGADALRLSF